MSSDPLSDARIVDSWKKNAAAWTDAVRQNQIESRTLVTNQAIVDAVLSRLPRTVLDVGCGEGWLVRSLAEHNIRAIGVDVVPSLIEKASRAGRSPAASSPSRSIALSRISRSSERSLSRVWSREFLAC